jgi:hypothetical protein
MGNNFKAVMKAKQERAERTERPKVEWFSLKNGETKYVRFLQEFDTDHRNYDSTFGTAVFLTEHVSPEEWSRKALCTIDDEGRCFACEMDKEQPKIVEDGKDRWHPWGQKSNFYVYVVDNKGDVRVMSRPTTGKFFDAICEEIEENDNSLIDLTFKVSKGPANQNPWEIRSTKKEQFEVPSLPELIDLNTAVGHKVTYAEQKGFYLPHAAKSAPAADVPTVSSSTAQKIGEDW